MINNIDVTLRDGGYQNGFCFPSDYAAKHAQMLTESGVEWIEIGYRNGSFKPIPNIGMTGLTPDSYIHFIHAAAPEAKVVVIAHPHNITTEDIKEMKASGISMLRLCIKADNPQRAIELCKFAKSVGLKVSINLVRVSQASHDKLIEIAHLYQDAGADIFYLADSNGSLLPEQVSHLVCLVRLKTHLEVGFHAHDNLGLAVANSIEAVRSGATFIDSSLTGMGKGAGNLALESWLALLNFYEQQEIYNIGVVLSQINILQSGNFFNASKRTVLDMIMGLSNLNADYRAIVEATLGQDVPSVFKKIKKLTTEKVM
ncbi:3-hydroxy-3-methylglutaryl-CoA lyase [Cedecea davisae]|uniref:3-hydroxy-3-methylglutaryl-CoA lyase n=1 Tax=Cedecea davisae TaxID=158484 RepID=UPI00242D7C82|nr:3-hydroxy-3-methylglutaryl-CoA lyase [Cedecea davisae]